MTKAKLIKRYEDYPEKTKEYINDLIEAFVQEYGKVDDTYTISFDMICDWHRTYLKAHDIIKNTDDLKEITKAYHIANTASNIIISITKSFGLTPMSKTRMNSVRISKNQPIDAESLINNLLEE